MISEIVHHVKVNQTQNRLAKLAQSNSDSRVGIFILFMKLRPFPPARSGAFIVKNGTI
jgi:hypothetical protein